MSEAALKKKKKEQAETAQKNSTTFRLWNNTFET